MANKDRYSFFDREISWLSFNARVLQEAASPDLPLFERLNFLAIYSSNLDEFFRVRVASLRSLLRLKNKWIDKLDFHPARLLNQIYRIVSRQQEEFGQILRTQILPGLEAEGIVLLDESTVTDEQADTLRAYFDAEVRPLIETVPLDPDEEPPFLHNAGLYLVAELWPGDESSLTSDAPSRYVLVEIPSPPLPRFVDVEMPGDRCGVIFLDDVVRLRLDTLFPDEEVAYAYAVKLTRDADLYVDDEFSGDLVEMIRKALGKRETGLPSRFLYDNRMPYGMISFLKRALRLEDEDIVTGGRYHNLNDFFDFPRFGRDDLTYDPMPPLPHPTLSADGSMFEIVADRDRLLHTPYQAYDPVLRFLEEAAHDEHVEEIWMTLYRVAPESGIARRLMEAAEQGKRVTAFVEIKARFDEAPNLGWAEQMEEAGVRVLYSIPGIKVHAKLALVVRREGDAQRRYALFSTGNFNEKTAHVYADEILFTADDRLASELRLVFGMLAGEEETPAFEHLFVAPHALRKAFYALIDREIEEAEAGRRAEMVLKMNNLEDPKIIRRLYRASRAGVKIRMIVRGICRLVPGVEGQSENIVVTSIVDRFLEHSRMYWFHHGGEPKLYLASADWMKRNLSERVEVAFPIYDPHIRADVLAMLDTQLADNTKARLVDAALLNEFHAPEGAEEGTVRSQFATYARLEAELAAAEVADGAGEVGVG